MSALDVVAAATLAWLLAFAPRLKWQTWSIHHHVAAAAILYPAMRASLSFIDLAPLLGQFTVLRPYSVAQLDRIPWRIAERNLTIPFLGLGLVALLGSARVARRHAAVALRPWSAWRGELGRGAAVVPLFVIAEAVGLALLAGPAAFLNTGDESALFANATLYHVLLLSLVPGFVEELYYRGLLQGTLSMVFTGRRGAWLAIAVQGVIFGVAHAGFTTFAHLIGPLLFGLAMGYVRATLGLGACMVCHASVNLFYFSVDPGAGSDILLVLVGALVLAGLVVLATRAKHIWARARGGPRPLEEGLG